ncbi:MAG TPA: hypothetical protein PL064_07945, partial [Thermogutta sp.]|nr:hypothetical protein [Thermogutta sp.]
TKTRNVFSVTCLALVGLALLFFALPGCGGKRSVPGRPKTVPVKVTVLYRGAPVAEANVQFLPEGSGNAATGVTDANGIARLTTFDQNDGAVHGKYRVTIRKSIQVGGSNPADPDAPPVPATYREELPAKYAAPETSGLTAEVSESQKEFTFELTD